MADTATPTTHDALADTAQVVTTLLQQRAITGKNPQTGQTENRPVPFSKVTVDTEMTEMAGKKTQSLVFKIHLDHADTLYQGQIAEQAQAVLGEIHPLLKTLRPGSYRDDTSVSLVADLPEGKTPDEVITDILQTKKMAENMVQSVTGQAPAVAEPVTTTATSGAPENVTDADAAAKNTVVVNASSPTVCPAPVVTINNTNTTVTGSPEADTTVAPENTQTATNKVTAPLLATPPVSQVDKLMAQGTSSISRA